MWKWVLFPKVDPACGCIFPRAGWSRRDLFADPVLLSPGFWFAGWFTEASPVTQTVKNLPATQETWVWSRGWEDSLEKGTATHSSILVWRIPWTEEPGGLESMGSQRVGHDWATFTLLGPRDRRAGTCFKGWLQCPFLQDALGTLPHYRLEELCLPTTVKSECSQIKYQHKNNICSFNKVLAHLLWDKTLFEELERQWWRHMGDSLPLQSLETGASQIIKEANRTSQIVVCYSSTWKEFTSQGVTVEETAGAKGLGQKEASEHEGNHKKAHRTMKAHEQRSGRREMWPEK